MISDVMWGRIEPLMPADPVRGAGKRGLGTQIAVEPGPQVRQRRRVDQPGHGRAHLLERSARLQGRLPGVGDHPDGHSWQQVQQRLSLAASRRHLLHHGSRSVSAIAAEDPNNVRPGPGGL
ncbi:hypothetical protein PUR61_01000 [Streptomyces sp. BE20]|uniref:hypothetical protein n=1 Tax=Streptomyces sp. BE20 TaxID=3002525 RepID=UPI002E76E015|nr:hypothetical protein [Streptomyces sp. BE20]MEE1820788.1 hypothetical protein [Streptomyces sp. BE20]